MVVMGLELGQTFDDRTYRVLFSYVQKYFPFIMYCEVCCSLQIKQIVYKHMNTWVAHWAIKVKFHIHISTSVLEIFNLGVFSLQTCHSVVNMLVIGLVLGLSLIVISITGICFMQKYLPL